MKNILVLSTYGAENPYGGGKYVLYHLFCRLSYRFNIKLLSLTESDKIKKQIMIKPNFENIQIPQDIRQATIQWEMEKKYQESLFDIVQIDNWETNTDYLEQVQKYASSSDIIILEHPYLVNLVNYVNKKIPIVYHAHNLELSQKRPILKEDELLCGIKNAEQKACDISSQVWVSSEEEQTMFKDEYHVVENKLKILPHGVDISNSKFIERSRGNNARSKIIDLRDKTIFVFTGSWHPPNLESLNFIISNLSCLNKNYLFFIVGSVKDYYFYKNPNGMIPENVILFGTVTDEEKYGIYELSDFAINPMFSGAGTNLKMLEYMSVGLPIISTQFGARGIKTSKETIICKNGEFVNCIETIRKLNYHVSTSIHENYHIVKNIYDYDKISQTCINFLNELETHEFSLDKIFPNLVSTLNDMSIHDNDVILETISKEMESITNTKKY